MQGRLSPETHTLGPPIRPASHSPHGVCERGRSHTERVGRRGGQWRMTRDGKTQTFQNETREVISHEKEVSVNAVRVLPMCRAPRGTFSTHLSSHLAFEYLRARSAPSPFSPHSEGQRVRAAKSGQDTCLVLLIRLLEFYPRRMLSFFNGVEFYSLSFYGLWT